jgi:hypothetical protein
LGTGWDPLSSFGSLTYWNDPYVSEPETGAEADDAKRSSTASDDLIGPTPPTEAPTAA